MSEQINDGGPAFPMPLAGVGGGEDAMFSRLDENTPLNKRHLLGMTLRDYFAAKAMAGIMANADLPDLMHKGFNPDPAAEACYMVADAMLVARENK